MTTREINEKESKKIFARELGKLIAQAGLKHVEFAREIGVDENSVYMWTKGKTQPKLYQLKLIIEYFTSCNKTRNFNPLQLFVPESVLNKTKSTAYQKAIHQIQEAYDLQLRQQVKESTINLQNELDSLQEKYDERLEKNYELSHNNSYYKLTLEDRDYYKAKLSEVNEKERTYKKELRETLVKSVVLHNVYPESTAKKVLWNEDLRKIIEKMYEYEKENGLTGTYKKYYNELVQKIIDTLGKELTDAIKRIYNPED